MLVFVDESGDTGLKLDKGSSRYFIIALVTFEDIDEANACDQRISLLRKEMRLHPNSEFKFSKLLLKQRIDFFRAVQPYSFFYSCIVVDKDPKKLHGNGFKVKESFYKCICGYAFETAKPYLKNAIVVVDGSGSKQFKRQFSAYLKRRVGTDIVKKVKLQNSKTNNLIQLADMVAGAINRNFSSHNDKDTYRNALSSKEINVQLWPK